jgi:hypothetical protein
VHADRLLAAGRAVAWAHAGTDWCRVLDAEAEVTVMPNKAALTAPLAASAITAPLILRDNFMSLFLS